MEEIAEALKNDLFVFILLLASLFVGVFGAANWNDYIYPKVPEKSYWMTDAEYKNRMEQFEREIQEVGQRAVVPKVWAIPMAVVGFAGAAGFGILIFSRHCTP